MHAAPTRRVVPVDGIPMSGLFAEAPDARAVIVALHGGGSSAAYFDCPGRPDLSLLRAGAAAGFSVIALDRPGYGTSAPYADEMWDPTRRVDLAFCAAEAMLGARPRGAGLFIMAHSNGCELGLRMAVDCRRHDVIGVELAGTGAPAVLVGEGRTFGKGLVQYYFPTAVGGGTSRGGLKVTVARYLSPAPGRRAERWGRGSLPSTASPGEGAEDRPRRK